MDFKELSNSRMISELVDMLAGELANDPNAPDGMRVSSQLITAEHKIVRKISAATRKFMVPLGPECSDEVIKQGKEFVAYLECVAAGLDNFLAQYNNK